MDEFMIRETVDILVETLKIFDNYLKSCYTILAV